MKFRKLLPLAALLALCACRLDGADNSWDAWRQGYTSFTQGEQRRDRGDYTGALDSFQRALSFYNEVRKNRPDWNQEIIGARIRDCEREIAVIRERLGSEPPSSSPVTEPAVPSAPRAADLTRIRRELDQYKQRLVEALVAKEELEKQLRQAKTAASEVSGLLREQRILQEKYALLERRYRELEEQSLQPDGKIEELQKQLVEEKLNSDLLQRKLTLAEAKVKKYEKDTVDLYRERSDARQTLKTKTDEVNRLQRELEELRLFQTNATAREREFRQEIDKLTLENKNLKLRSDASTQENTTLRARLDDVTRNGADSPGLNKELLAENRKFRDEAVTLQSRIAELESSVGQLQNSQRDLQLELVKNRETLQRVDSARARLEQEALTLRKAAEQERGSSELVSVELQNLRERNRQLENDLQQAAGRIEQLSGRLSTRQTSGDRALAEAESARRKAEKENLKLQEQLSAARVQVEESAKETKKASEAQTALQAALVKEKSAAAALAEQLKSLSEQSAEFRKREEALARLQTQYDALALNFKGMQKENADLRTEQKKRQELEEELTRLRTELGKVEQLRKALAEEQRGNEALKSANAKLEQELKNRPVIAEQPPAPRQPKTPEVTVVSELGSGADLIAAARKAEKEESPDLAIWNYQAALALEPENTDALLSLGRLYLKREEYERAEPLFGRARIAKNPPPEAAPLQALALNGMHRYGNALALLDPLLASQPDNFDLLYPSAIALAGSGQTKLAEERFRKAEKLRPNDPAPKVELARLLLKDGSKNEAAAAELYQTARKLGARPDLELEPRLGKLLDEKRELTEFMTAAAKEAENAGDWTGAAWYYRQLLDNNPDSADLPIRLALALALSGETPAALEVLELNAPGNALNRTTAGLIRLRAGEPSAALPLLKEALKATGGKAAANASEWPILFRTVAEYLKSPDARSSVDANSASLLLKKLCP